MPTFDQTWRGGARIDSANATWPFAKLSVSREQLVLQVFILGTYVFKQDDVLRIEPYGIIPIAGKGVRIHHRVAHYPKKIVFWYLCVNPQPIVDSLRAFGFGS
jgi:hypothetical protein